MIEKVEEPNRKNEHAIFSIASASSECIDQIQCVITQIVFR